MAEFSEKEKDQVRELLPMPDEIREEMVAFVGEAAGAVWNRTEQLDSRARSLSTIAMLAALGRSDELAIHVRLGQENFGVTRKEIGEILMHAAVYAGFPAAISGMRIAKRVFEEMDAAS